MMARHGLLSQRALLTAGALSTLLVLGTTAAAQDPGDLSKRGERVYGTSCATGYCHTLGGGSGGGAARLAARGFDLAHIQNAVTKGMPQTRMPAFGTLLPAEDLNAVIAYVASLNGIDAGATAAVATPARAPLSPAAERGRELLHAADRGYGRCATCHQVAGSGVPVADPIAQVPDSVPALRRLTTPDVATVTLAGDSMPGLVISPGAARTVFYDLTVAPPVLRTVPTAAIKVTEGSRWQHDRVLSHYTTVELEDVLTYLREAR
ncbi:MAG: c-type cytochrome [Gammaproteobacteria bacterium]|nr:c-type cytochrome [Gammaproteobacteria bacterium]